MRVSRFLLPASIGLVLACSGSSLEVAPEDGGDDSSIADSGTTSDTSTRGDTTKDDTTVVDSVSTDAPPGDSTPPPDVTPDAPPDVVADSGGGPCSAGSACPTFLHCCSGACVNEQNDPLNCGGCGIVCSGATPMCEAGHCVAATCEPACGSGQTCCLVDGPGPSGGPKCVDGPTCPIGCPACG
jgi:hypothetical protein